MSLGNLSPGKLKILKAVSELLEDPSTKVTINTIAGAVHVTEAAIYRYYRSKDDIFAALVAYMEMNLLPEEGLAITDNTLTTDMENLFRQYIGFLEDHPGLARLFLGHCTADATGITDRIRLLSAKIRAHVAQLLHRAKATGQLNSGLQPEQGVELFYGLITGAAMGYIYAFPQLSAEARWKAYAGIVFTPAAKMTSAA